MKITITKNNDLFGWDLIDEKSNQSHDGDNAKEVIATVYDGKNAYLIAKALEAL